MFRPEDIEKTTVYLSKEDKDKLFTELHEAGVCEVIKKDDNVSSELNEAIELLQYVHRIKNRFEPYKVEGLKNIQPIKRSKNTFTKIEKELKDIDIGSNEVLDIIHKKEQDIEQAKHVISTLKILPDDIKTSLYSKGKFISVEVGTIPIDTLSKLKEENIPFASKHISDDQALIIAIGDLELDKKLFSHGFIRIEFEKSDKNPKQLMIDAEKSIIDAEKEIQEAKDQLHTMSKIISPSLEIYEEEVDIYVRELTGVDQSLNYESFAHFQAWVSKSKKGKFESILKKHASSAVYVYETDDEVAPTKLKNSSLIRPFELITKLYSVPKSKGFDPTIFIAFTFPLFFGLMLTDFAYGLAMFLFASALFLKSPKREEATRAFSALLIVSGISTMAFGIIFGSYFGNFFQNLGIQVPALLDSMKDIIPMIAIVLTMGIVHISMGLIVGFIENMKSKEYFNAFKDQGVWIIFVISILLMLTGGLMGVTTITNSGLAVLGVSLLMQFALSFKKDGPINAVLSLFDFSGFMGDVFSYIRLMALAIGTSGIALAVNFMVVMAYDMLPYIGIVFAILIFIVGHLFNLVMNGLGGFIHTLRLHFLEHFSKYYDGGGKEYTPYYANRNKTLQKEIKN